MDWFKRYGIPGAYFVGLTIAWMYAFYTCWPVRLDIKDLIGIGAGVFLPAGYIISIFQQTLYLMFNGLHNSAAQHVSGFFNGNPPREYITEAISAILASQGDTEFLENRKFIQASIQKRSDVLVINASLILATFLAIIIGWSIGFFFGWVPQPRFWPVFILGVISGIIHFGVYANYLMLQDRVVYMITQEFFNYMSIVDHLGPLNISFPIRNYGLWTTGLLTDMHSDFRWSRLFGWLAVCLLPLTPVVIIWSPTVIIWFCQRWL